MPAHQASCRYLVNPGTHVGGAFGAFFVLVAGIWQTLAPWSAVRFAHSACVIVGRLLIAGGYGIGGRSLYSIEYFVPVAGFWLTLAPLSVSFVIGGQLNIVGSFGVCFAVGGQLYIVGGYGVGALALRLALFCMSKKVVLLLQLYVVSGRGVDVPCLNSPSALIQLQVFGKPWHPCRQRDVDIWLMPVALTSMSKKVVLLPQLFLVSCLGVGGPCLNSTECLVPVAGIWHTLAPMSAVRCRLLAPAIGGQLYIIGGYGVGVLAMWLALLCMSKEVVLLLQLYVVSGRGVDVPCLNAPSALIQLQVFGKLWNPCR